MRALIFIGCSIVGMCLPVAADAQVSGYGAQVLRCESNDGRRKLCPADVGDDGVTLIRQLSRSVCVRNQTWGTNQRGVWVSQGCRAEFRIGGRDVEDEEDQRREHVVRCESPRGALNECRVDARGGVRLLRQLSSNPCVAGRSWGQDRGVIWVSRGCRADFVIGASSGEDREGYDAARVVRCESQDGRPQRCDTPLARGALLLRQLSRTPCVQDRNWGWDRRGVWVGEGCRGEFSVW
ncbi:MAG: DUF3011 domain-containing protein [Lysobacterales bacterium]